MTGAKRQWWWLLGGCLVLAVGVVLMSPLTDGEACSGVAYGPDAASVEAAGDACVESLNAGQRIWTIGAVLLLIGLATVAYDVGHRRGRRAGHMDVEEHP
jgi:peptidoglycan/LPS O-acetylase OafA/YrhL